MPERITKNRESDFVAALESLGGSAGNGKLRQQLGWEEQFYWKVQGKLVEDGRIVPGRGKGGSVRLSTAELEPVVAAEGAPLAEAASQDEALRRHKSERRLYEPLQRTIEETWIQRFGFDEIRIAQTHFQGSKATGGEFTRPDITVAAIKRYVFLPKRLEIITF
jgi:hypothetical protein